ncbi:DUF2141 domain-containing protein [Cellvibrio sp. KB43]|uniref:DUF2141 domain-containing protein n=1 Tax=Cellvibrio polysaccharolyticus TaxID=2082724 RepID=A0A928UZD6_9GAMM|nr:DUF2141 domain-containing protein [Cellvibrio polysaccharolyticus]
MAFFRASQFITAVFGCKYLPRRRFVTLYTFIGLCLAGSTALAAPVEFTFEDNRVPGGQVYLAIYKADQAKGWDDAPTHQEKLTLGDSENWKTTLELAPGRYAARAFIDVDGNGELKTARSGRPQEPFAISLGDGRKKASIRFQQAVFEVSDSAASVTMPLLYPKGSLDH